jgi:hypothetical protein
MQFATVLEQLGIPHEPVPSGKEAEWLKKCLDVVFDLNRFPTQGVRETPERYMFQAELLVDLE